MKKVHILSVNSLSVLFSLFVLLSHEQRETKHLLHNPPNIEQGIPANLPLSHTDEYKHSRWDCDYESQCLSWTEDDLIL